MSVRERAACLRCLVVVLAALALPARAASSPPETLETIADPGLRQPSRSSKTAGASRTSMPRAKQTCFLTRATTWRVTGCSSSNYGGGKLPAPWRRFSGRGN